MNQYTLDYSSGPRQRLRISKPDRRMNRTFRQILLPVCGLVVSIAVFNTLQMRSESQMHRKLYLTQSVKYDSLLDAKEEVDRQLKTFRSPFNKR